jgi:hypothetical protein
VLALLALPVDLWLLHIMLPCFLGVSEHSLVSQVEFPQKVIYFVLTRVAFSKECFGKMSDDWEDINGSEASDYFFHELIGTYTLDEDMRPTRIMPANVFYLALTWGL